MSNSSLANYIDRTTGNYSFRTSLISKITIHFSFAAGDKYDISALINKSSGTSYHYGIDTLGTIGLFVDEKFRSWSTGNAGNDDCAVNILLMSSQNDTNKPSPETLSALLNLCEDICRRNFIKSLTYTGSAETSNLTMHRWFANTECPGSYMANYYPKIVEEINRRLSSSKKASSQSEQLKAASTIALKAINPYMATIDENAKGINYLDLKECGVIGVMFSAGAYYDSQHVKRSRYINRNLKNQIEELDGALPYALHATVRARSAKEAKLECNELYLVISKYPPKLGLWLNLDLSITSPNTAKQIIDTYYEYIYKWGLKDKCGLYCTRQQAKLVGWTRYTDKFCLWLVEKSASIENLDELLTPTFFKI